MGAPGPRARSRTAGGAVLCAAVCGLALVRQGAWTFASGSLSLAKGLATGSGIARASRPSPVARHAVEVDEDEYIEVWDQTVQELALDVRELLITDANVYFIGPDIDTYRPAIEEVTRKLNYTMKAFDFEDLVNATEVIDNLETIFEVPPLVGVQRWAWSVMRQGLVVWLDPDGYEHLNVYERDRIRKLKFPKKKAAFGPAKPPSLLTPSEEMPGDPIDMWMESDVHVDLQHHKDIPVEKAIMGSIINAILDSPPKWRGWMKQAKIRGTIGGDYETPFEARRNFHSHGVSPRLNRLLNA